MEPSDLDALQRLNRILLARNLALADDRFSVAHLMIGSIIAGAFGLAFVLILLEWLSR